MPEKFRIQAQQDGEWKTQCVFDEGANFSDIRGQAQQLLDTETFEDVRVLEKVFDTAKDKSSYRLRPLAGEQNLSTLETHEGDKTLPNLVLRTKKGLTGEWVYISKKQASYHPLYGVEGWLAYYSYLLIASPIFLAIGFGQSGTIFTIGGAATIFFACAVNWYLYHLLTKKNSNFVIIAVILLAVYLCISFLGALAGDLSGVLGTARAFLELGYLCFSLRVNVTLLNRVRRRDLRHVLGPKQIDNVLFVDVATQPLDR